MKLSVASLCLIAPAAAAFAPAPKVSSGSSLCAKFLKSGSAGTEEGWIDPSAPVNSEASHRLTLKKSLEGAQFQKRLSLLGSTGSIGTQTLDIVDACHDNFVVDALFAGTNVKLMAEQVLKYRPKIASLATLEAAKELEERLAGVQDKDPS